MSANSPDSKNSLPMIADCNGCGVCCFHMGYPAFILPRQPMTQQQIDADPELVAKIKKAPRLNDELLAGNPGESYWHDLPDDLRSQWQAYVDQYALPTYGDDPSTFDGPCIWFDMETRQCQNHEHRPRICRDFETGSSECLSWREYYQDKILLNPPAAN